MQDSNSIHRIAAKYLALSGLMDERMSRQRAAAEATAYGWGGVRAVSRAIGMSPHTIRKGLSELAGQAFVGNRASLFFWASGRLIWAGPGSPSTTARP
jgi:hypothetical protein